MITQAEIQSIDYNSNSCTVRMPLFESVSSGNPVIVEAKFICLPGIFNGYIVGDIVWVAFDREIYSHPVIVGKVYKGIAVENQVETSGELVHKGGSINCLDFAASNSAKLPVSTAITNADASYNTLEKIINQIKDIKLYGTSGTGSGGIEANPTEAPRAELTAIKINGIVYSVASGDDVIHGGTASTPDSMYTSTIGGGDARSISEEIPEPPNTNGTYVLRCTVENGIRHYRWVEVE